jgi:hypothetical protein
MINVYISFALMALILSAMIIGMVNDHKQFKKRLNALKQPVKNNGLDDWFSERFNQALAEIKNGD